MRQNSLKCKREKRKVLHLTQRENELKESNERLKAELVAKDNELT
jgi:hypothetical protein